MEDDFIKKAFGISISVILTILTLWVFINPLQTSYALAAEGSSSNFVYIEKAIDLFKLTDISNTGKTFRLSNDIDLEKDKSWQANVDDYQNGWLPLDTFDMSACVFDGGGYTIWNLRIDRNEKYIGLFSTNSLDIKNLFLDFVNITGGGSAGALSALNYGTIENVHAKGSVQGNIKAGGLISENFGSIDNCSFDGDVSGRTAGGLLAENSSELITNSYSQGTVKGHLVGGLIGVTGYMTGEIKTSLSISNIVADKYDSTPQRIAGFIAIRYENVQIENCYSLFGNTPVANGTSDGITTLSASQFLQQENLAGFDFDNYWTLSGGMLEQRTIAISCNKVFMSKVAVSIVGDRKYYLSGESAVLLLDSGGKQNIGIKNVYVCGVDAKNKFVDNEYDYGQIESQINIEFEGWYLIKIEINALVAGEIIMPEKAYYAPHEEIIIYAKIIDGYKEPEIISRLLGTDVVFTNISTEKDLKDGYYKYSAKLSNASFQETSLLNIDVSYEVLQSPTNLYTYLAIVGLSIAFIVATAIVVHKTKLKRRAK